MIVATFFSAAQLERGRVTPLFSRAVGIDSRAHPEDVRDVECPRCEGSGLRMEYDSWFDTHTGSAGEGYYHTNEPCPYCNGDGYEIIEVEPIDIDDLNQAHSASVASQSASTLEAGLAGADMEE